LRGSVGLTPLHAINTNENLIGLVNGNGVSIHHVANRALI
jgi:chemotaxis protein CheZ